MKHTKKPWERIEEESVAKARLMEAAPDMLELLEKVARLLDRLMKQVNWGDSAINAECLGELNETLLQMPRIIRQAKGE